MKIKSIACKAFKRFTDLTIHDIPIEAKLICLIGSNGSGKSSLFDLFNYCITPSKNVGAFYLDTEYHIKVGEESKTRNSFFQDIAIEFYDYPPINSKTREIKKEAFYIRSAYRHEADIKIEYLGQQDDILLDSNRPQILISKDVRISDNYIRIVADAVESIFSDRLPVGSTKIEIRDRLLKKARESLLKLFPGLIFEGVGNPMENGTFYFTKGTSKNWKYKNLSAGEKAAFDLILDFIIKSEAFNNTIFGIDEPELHMHTKLQSQLLEELYNLTPENSQLWVATHSIGMVRKAKELSEEHPNTVIFLDFDNNDFDQQVKMLPAKVSRAFWRKTFSGTIGNLAELVAPSKIIFCEGNLNGEFDSKCFQSIFTNEFPDVEFISLGGDNEVEKNSTLLATVFKKILSGVHISCIIDRDDRSNNEVAELNSQGTKVLSKRSIESFLFDDEILKKLCDVNQKSDKFQDILKAKEEARASSESRGNPQDDYKALGGELYNKIKKILNLTQCGNTRDAFCFSTLVPLITHETKIYQELKKDVF